jgi:hypothetical protein
VHNCFWRKRRINIVSVYAGLKILVAESKCAKSNGKTSQKLLSDSRDGLMLCKKVIYI